MGCVSLNMGVEWAENVLKRAMGPRRVMVLEQVAVSLCGNGSAKDSDEGKNFGIN